MSNATADDFAPPSGDSMKFEKVGDSIAGTVTYLGDWQERVNKFNGHDEQVRKIGIDTGTGDPTFIWPVKGSSMAQAIGEALRETKSTLQVGDKLKVTYAEDRDTGKPSPWKVFKATHKPGAPLPPEEDF